MTLLLSPGTIATALGLAPQVGDIGKKLGDRYKRYEKMLIEAPYVPPGESVVTASAQPFIEKRAALQSAEKTAAPPRLALIGEALSKAVKNLATPGGLLVGGSLIGLGTLGMPAMETMGKRIQKSIAPLPERAEMDRNIAEAYAKSVGKELGIKSVGLLGDFLSKAVAAPTALFQNKERASVFAALQQEDDVISQADPKTIAEAYHTMVRFAPTLATDKNAVKTFLRESVLYGTGPNFVAIKQLADAEKAVNPPVIGKK